MKTTIALTLLLLLTGCHRPLSGKPKPSEVSKFSTTPLPVPPPVPDPAPVTQDVTGAASDVAAAQANVQQVLKVAETTPAAGAAVAPLTSADAHLTAAAGKLGDATALITKLGEDLKASEATHTNTETILKGDIEKLKSAAGADAAANAKQVAALTKENEDQRNEFMHQQKVRLFWTGLALLLGMGGCFAGVAYGFAPGLRLGLCFGALGSFLIVLSVMLEKIVFFGELACGAGVIALLIYAAWHFFHHDPLLIPGGKPNDAA